LQVAFANIKDIDEAGSGAALTVEASIEYPVGTITRLTWNGSTTQSIADATIGALSDSLTIAIPKNALFYVRSFITGAGGVPYNGVAGAGNFPLGGAEFAASGLSSKVMSGTIAAGSAMVLPCLIVGPTTAPSCFLAGDSITHGFADVFNDLSCDLGILARSIGPYYGYVLSGYTGTSLLQFNATSSKKLAAVLPYVTHVISGYGFNDLGDAGTAATVISRMATFAALSGMSTKKLFQTTITPKATSSDSFATEANQTAVNATERASLNKQIVAGLPGFAGHFDIGREMEGALYSGKWRVDLGLPTGDNTHPTAAVYQAMRRTRAIDPALIKRP
jgi:lysophospholipase L1-like esterase